LEDDRLNVWKTLFARALELIDSVASAGRSLEDWTFGGGTVLMIRHHHRLSKDVDIFVPEGQYLPYLTPRLNGKAELLTSDYTEDHRSVKLRFKEGEIDFVASASLSAHPYELLEVLGRRVRVETSTEIIAKKVWHRGALFTGRDLFDLAMVAENESAALASIQPVLQSQGGVILERLDRQSDALRQAFEALDVLEYRRSFDECVAIAKSVLR
jgi:Nucleotidyl transferase AbiEii toxin, Type IV TA system